MGRPDLPIRVAVAQQDRLVIIQTDLKRYAHVSILERNSGTVKLDLSAANTILNGQFFGKF
jgi:hypothetical protein